MTATAAEIQEWLQSIDRRHANMSWPSGRNQGCPRIETTHRSSSLSVAINAIDVRISPDPFSNTPIVPDT